MAVFVVDGDSFDFVEGYAASDLYTKTEVNKLWYLSQNAVTLDVNHISAEIMCIGNYLGTISATSSATSYATVSVDGKKVIIYGKASGSATVTITDSYSETSKTVAVTVAANFPNPTLNSNTPAQIQAAARAGVASQLWSVGDRIGIAISGTVGIQSLNLTRYAYILGFNHNSAVEGTNTIHFQLGFTASSGGVNICFTDANYGNTATSGYIMNASATNAGGWAASYMRNTVCPSLLAAMSSEWQAVVTPCTKFTDNVGGNPLAESSVTATADKVFLLSQYEIMGAVSQYINPAEPVAQRQYDYYANGNSKIKYKSNATSTTATWWTRSARNGGTNGFRQITEDGSSNSANGDKSNGFAPAFMVA